MNILIKNTIKAAIILLLLWQLPFSANAQGVSINNSGATPDTSAILDISSTVKGMLVPRMTTAQRNAIFSPADGLMIFNIDCGEFQYRISSGWISIIGSSSIGQPGAIVGPAFACSGQSGVSYHIAPVSGATSYIWTIPSGATIVSGLGTDSITVNFGTSAGFISVRASNGCSTSPSSDLDVNVTITPTVPGAISGSAAVCTAQSGSVYSISPVLGAVSYLWTLPAGSTVTSGAGTNSITVTFGSTSGNITVATVNPCGTSGVSTLPVTVTSVPASPGSITGNTNPNLNQSGVAYSIAAVAGATGYTWTVPSGSTITAGQGTTGITVTFGTSSGSICVTADNSCGSGTASCMAVSVGCFVTGSQTFTYTGSIQTFTVPACVTSVTIEAWGAEGGRGKQYTTSYYSTGVPGKGARMKGTFTVTPGETIKVLVGQKGGEKIVSNQLGGGGGGGSFVTRNNNIAMLIAGGGGGSGRYDGDNGADGTTASSGTAGNGSNGGAGGTGGNGGITPSCSYAGGSGAGYTGNGQNHGGSDAQAFVNGGAGASAGTSWSDGNTGGFGGGGGTGPHGGAGGGGYSGGGGGGDINCGGNGGGGGGGSYNGGTAQSNSSGIQTGNGQVIITW
ncbi:MAG: hypothetical protein WCM76_06120 [Bacteroidota bacterium]